MSEKVSTREGHMSKEMERDIDERTTAIWAWVREHRHSLDSEIGYRKMREAIDATAGSLQYQLAPLIEEISQLKLKLSIVKDKAIGDCNERDKTIQALQKEAKSARTKYAKAIKELEELKATALEVVAAWSAIDTDDDSLDLQQAGENL